MTLLKLETWIKAGYDLLGTGGLEGIKIERLARILGLNKSGFYYYFNTMEGFLMHVLEYHVRMAREVAAELQQCNNIDPDVLLVVVRCKTFFLVESQLLHKNRNVHLHLNVDEAGSIVSDELIHLWHRIGESHADPETVMAYVKIIRHFFYARITADEIDYAFLRSLAAETKDVLVKVSSERHD
jgi:AcrR family transcriptional regulator